MFVVNYTDVPFEPDGSFPSEFSLHDVCSIFCRSEFHKIKKNGKTHKTIFVASKFKTNHTYCTMRYIITHLFCTQSRCISGLIFYAIIYYTHDKPFFNLFDRLPFVQTKLNGLFSTVQPCLIKKTSFVLILLRYGLNENEECSRLNILQVYFCVTFKNLNFLSD